MARTAWLYRNADQKQFTDLNIGFTTSIVHWGSSSSTEEMPAPRRNWSPRRKERLRTQLDITGRSLKFYLVMRASSGDWHESWWNLLNTRQSLELLLANSNEFSCMKIIHLNRSRGLPLRTGTCMDHTGVFNCATLGSSMLVLRVRSGGCATSASCRLLTPSESAH